MLNTIICFIVVVLPACYGIWMDSISKDPNGRIFLDVEVRKNDAEQTKIIGVRPEAILVHLKTPHPGTTVNDALIQYFANLLGVGKEQFKIFSDTGKHKILELLNIKIQLDDILMKINFEIYIK